MTAVSKRYYDRSAGSRPSLCQSVPLPQKCRHRHVPPEGSDQLSWPRLHGPIATRQNYNESCSWTYTLKVFAGMLSDNACSNCLPACDTLAHFISMSLQYLFWTWLTDCYLLTAVSTDSIKCNPSRRQDTLSRRPNALRDRCSKTRIQCITRVKSLVIHSGQNNHSMDAFMVRGVLSHSCVIHSLV